jgi:glutathione S-transferase
VLCDDRVTLADSSVICQYLEDRHPEPALFPAEVADRARARWLEEYADTRLGEVLIWRLFNQVAIRPAVWGEATDRQIVEQTLATDVPQILDYLEAELPAGGFLFGPLGIADVAIACFFRNAGFARFRIDEERWPRAAAFVDRVLASEPFLALKPYEDRLIRTPVAGHRAALAEMGAPLSAETLGTAAPRRGMMQL